MDENYNYLESSTEKIIRMLRDGFGDAFKSYYYGDPYLIPQANLPAVCVVELESDDDLTNAPTGFDRVEDQVQIRLVLDKRDDLGASDTEDLTQKKLERLAKGRDASTKQYLPNTLKGILRNQITLENSIINQVGKVRFGISPQDDGSLLAEARLDVYCSELVPFGSRN